MTDPIADMLTRIRNAYLAGHNTVKIPASKMKLEIARLLEESGFIANVIKKASKDKEFIVNLKYLDKKPVINHIERVSKPGRRTYVAATNLPRPLSGYGAAIISTSEGLMLNKEAKKRNLGGEVICQMW